MQVCHLQFSSPTAHLTFGDLMSPSTVHQTATVSAVLDGSKFNQSSPPRTLSNVAQSCSTPLSGHTSHSATLSTSVVTEQGDHEGGQALDLSMSSNSSDHSLDMSLSSPVATRESEVSLTSGLSTTSITSTETTDQVIPTVSKSKEELPNTSSGSKLKLTGEQQSLFTSMSEAFELAQSMLKKQKEATMQASQRQASSQLAAATKTQSNTSQLQDLNTAHQEFLCNLGQQGLLSPTKINTTQQAITSQGILQATSSANVIYPSPSGAASRSLIVQQPPRAGQLVTNRSVPVRKLLPATLGGTQQIAKLNVIQAQKACSSVLSGLDTKISTTVSQQTQMVSTTGVINSPISIAGRNPAVSTVLSMQTSPRTATLANPNYLSNVGVPNAATSLAAQQNILYQQQQQQQNSQPQTFLVNIPVMPHTTGTGALSIPTTSIRASQVKQIKNGRAESIVVQIQGEKKQSGSQSHSQTRTVGQMLKASREKSQVATQIINSQPLLSGMVVVSSASQVSGTGIIQIQSPGKVTTNVATVTKPCTTKTVNVVNVIPTPNQGAVLLSSPTKINTQPQQSNQTLLISSPTRLNPVSQVNVVGARIPGTTGFANILSPTTVVQPQIGLIQQQPAISVQLQTQPVLTNQGVCIVQQPVTPNTQLSTNIVNQTNTPNTAPAGAKSLLTKKAKVLPQFGGSPKFGSTQFLLQGVTQIHPASAFQVDSQTPHFQNVMSKSILTNPSSSTIIKSEVNSSVKSELESRLQATENISVNVSTHSNNKSLVDYVDKNNSSDMDHPYGAIVSPNKVLQLVPQPIVPISQVSSAVTLNTSSALTGHKHSSDEDIHSYAMASPSKMRFVEQSGIIKSETTTKGDRNKAASSSSSVTVIKSDPPMPQSKQSSLYKMNVSSGEVRQTLIQTSSYSAFTGGSSKNKNKKSNTKTQDVTESHKPKKNIKGKPGEASPSKSPERKKTTKTTSDSKQKSPKSLQKIRKVKKKMTVAPKINSYTRN
ncbi:hypothetical protein KUTeg_016202 [Tegillarca granosa]|uniref:Uncharacterized protein n=1 Tax=Tegillarca granosa TaxID=220873 RepID=A0ABQ9ENZ8_TEGGR|nr:hypothetical protein KUTeg_016202 [Tegillarca granosa]